MDNRVVELSQLFKQKYGVEPQRVSPMPLSGSDRVYFRMFGDNFSVIGAYNPNLKLPLLKVKKDRLEYWRQQGAQATSTVKKLINH